MSIIQTAHIRKVWQQVVEEFPWNREEGLPQTRENELELQRLFFSIVLEEPITTAANYKVLGQLEGLCWRIAEDYSRESKYDPTKVILEAVAAIVANTIHDYLNPKTE